jgi:hypothetical protein
MTEHYDTFRVWLLGAEGMYAAISVQDLYAIRYEMIASTLHTSLERQSRIADTGARHETRWVAARLTAGKHHNPINV